MSASLKIIRQDEFVDLDDLDDLADDLVGDLVDDLVAHLQCLLL